MFFHMQMRCCSATQNALIIHSLGSESWCPIFSYRTECATSDSLQRDPIQSHALPWKREKIVTDIKFLGSILLQIFLNSVHQPRQRSYCEPCASILIKAGTWSQAPALGSESIFWIIMGMFFKLQLCFVVPIWSSRCKLIHSARFVPLSHFLSKIINAAARYPRSQSSARPRRCPL